MAELSERQLILVEHIIEFNGDVDAAIEDILAHDLIEDTDFKSLKRSSYVKSVKEEVRSRMTDKLTYATVAAVNVTVDLLSADNDTEQGALKLAAAKEVLDRTGTTKHTSVEVTMEQQPGIILLNPKAPAPNPDDYTDIDLDNPD